MTDIAHVFDNTIMRGDLAMADGLLVEDKALYTAILHSLFTDARAMADDLPVDDNDRRGWWGDLISPKPGDRYGSRLWLLRREKVTPQVLDRAEAYAQEALAWLMADHVARDVQVTAEYQAGDILALGVVITLINGKRRVFDFRYPWSN